MTPKELKQIRARCEAATEGPWQQCEEGGVEIIGNEDIIIVETSNPQILGCSVRSFDIAFISHARKNLPDCLDEIERLQGLVKRAYREGGELAFKDRMFDEDNYCWDHSKAREALEDKP